MSKTRVSRYPVIFECCMSETSFTPPRVSKLPRWHCDDDCSSLRSRLLGSCLCSCAFHLDCSCRGVHRNTCPDLNGKGSDAEVVPMWQASTASRTPQYASYAGHVRARICSCAPHVYLNEHTTQDSKSPAILPEPLNTSSPYRTLR
jgi:hypothetical protein